MIGRPAGEQKLVEPEPQRREQLGVDLLRSAPGEQPDQVVRGAAALDRAVGEPLGERAVAGVQPVTLDGGWKRAVRPGAVLEYAPHDLVGGAARR